MDILNKIRQRLEEIPPDHQVLLGIGAVITHIEVAERYLQRARGENDDHLFTDVIYRTNHAFEGILKEAYIILAEQNAARITPYQIEQYFSENNVLKERVKALFTNYRTEWRNTSTHDYSLFFSEQEAFLAIVSVSAFVAILLDQMVERIAFVQAQVAAAKRIELIKSNILSYAHLGFVGKIAGLLVELSEEIKRDWYRQERSEAQINGKIGGFIKSIFPEISVDLDSSFFADGQTLRPDLIVYDEHDKVIIEVKRRSQRRFNYPNHTGASTVEQLVHYLNVAQIQSGIVYYPPLESRDFISWEEVESDTNSGKKIIRVFPQSAGMWS